ncbi:MAG: hypothetical protein AAGC44_11560 [Planctomycetota bacterium]
MQAQQVLESLPPVCCGCWLLPVALIVAVGAMVEALTTRWQNRGLERGRLYCAACRFDLRGASSLTCPECGASLDSKGIVVGHHRPPPGLGFKLLLTMAITTTPIIVAVLVMLALLPFNYRQHEHVSMTDSSASTLRVEYVEFAVTAERKRLGQGLTKLNVVIHGSSFNPINLALQPNADVRRHFDQAAFADYVVETDLRFDGPAAQEMYREHLIRVVEHLQQGRGTSIELVPGPARVMYWSHREFSPHPLVVLAFAGLGLWLWGYLLIRTVKSNASAAEHYEQQRGVVGERYRRQVEQVIQQMHESDGSSEYEA